jgi:hypothetical protein
MLLSMGRWTTLAQARVTHRRWVDKVAPGEWQPDVDGVARLTIHGSRDFVQAVGKERWAQGRRYGMRSDGWHKDGVTQQSVFR